MEPKGTRSALPPAFTDWLIHAVLLQEASCGRRGRGTVSSFQGSAFLQAPVLVKGPQTQAEDSNAPSSPSAHTVVPFISIAVQGHEPRPSQAAPFIARALSKFLC